MGDLRHLAREGSANTFIGPEHVFDTFFCYVYLRGVLSYFDRNTIRDISVWAQAS